MPQRRILILGNGWLGNILKEYLGAEMSIARLEDLDETVISNYNVVINTAAKTNIDWCEQNKAEALTINAMDATKIAEVCANTGAKYVFISSACVFESKDESDIKTEDSAPNPGCFYAFTKYLAEQLITEVNPESLIIRIRLPISEMPNPRNTITKILKYPKLQTNQETVTIIEDMLPIFKELVDGNAKGVFHLVNDSTISPIEIGAIMRMHEFTAIKKEDMDREMVGAGRARRVTTVVHSTKIPPLPDVRYRMMQVARKYKEYAK